MKNVTMVLPAFISKRVFAAAVLAGAYVAPAFAQTPAQTPQVGLPSAPSAVRALEDESLAQPAGSSFVFKAPATQKGPGGIAIELPKDGPLALSLDDAIALGLQRNVRLQYDRANQRAVRADTLDVFSALTPDLRASASSGTQEINLAAMGFKPSLLANSPLLPPGFVFNHHRQGEHPRRRS